MKTAHLHIAKRLLCQLKPKGIVGHLENGILTVTDDSIGFRKNVDLAELVITDSAAFQAEVIYYCTRELLREHHCLTSDLTELNNLVGQ